MSENPLLEVLSIAEVVELWHLHPSSVKKGIFTQRKRLEARKCGRDWLVTYRSCVKRWGEPTKKGSLE